MVQGPALAIAPAPGELEQARLASRQEPLAGELRRGAQMQRRAPAGRTYGLGGKGVQVGLIAGRDLQGRRLDLNEVARREPGPNRRCDAGAHHQARAALCVNVGTAPGQVRKGMGQGLLRLRLEIWTLIV